MASQLRSVRTSRVVDVGVAEQRGLRAACSRCHRGRPAPCAGSGRARRRGGARTPRAPAPSAPGAGRGRSGSRRRRTRRWPPAEATAPAARGRATRGPPSRRRSGAPAGRPGTQPPPGLGATRRSRPPAAGRAPPSWCAAPGRRCARRRRPTPAAATGTPSSTCRSVSLSRSCARSGPRRGASVCEPAGETSSRTSLPRVTRVASRVRISSCTPSDGALVTGPGTPITRTVDQRRPVRGVERAAAHRGLDHDGAERGRRDHPVAGQEPELGRRAARRHLGHHDPGAGDVVEQVAVGRRVGPVDPAGEHRHRRAADRQRAAVRGLVDAVGGTGDHGDALAGQVGRDLAGHVAPYVVADRDPTTETERSSRLVEAAGAPHPQPERRAAPPVELARRGRGRRAGGPLLVAGHDEPDAPPRGPVEVAGRVEAVQPRRHVGGQPGRVALRRAGSRQTSAAPSSATSEASRGSPGSPSRPSATRASRSSSRRPVTAGPPGPASSPAAGHRCAAAARRRPRRRRAGRGRAGRRPSRRPGGPGWPPDR